MIMLIATRNAHKVQEIRSILGRKYQFHSLADFPNSPNISEHANTFEGNAKLKAIGLGKWIGGCAKAVFKEQVPSFVYVLADDSGLQVDALNGEPGVHSARFAALDTGAAGNSDDSANNAKLLKLLEQVPSEKRTARFRCVLALTKIPFSQLTRKSLLYTDESFLQHTRVFEGACEGKIAFGPSGKKGFGYDPLFIPTGYEKSFAELGDGIKNKMSHRAKALEKLRSFLDSETAQ